LAGGRETQSAQFLEHCAQLRAEHAVSGGAAQQAFSVSAGTGYRHPEGDQSLIAEAPPYPFVGKADRANPTSFAFSMNQDVPPPALWAPGQSITWARRRTDR